MPTSEPQPRDYVVTLQVYGPKVRPDVLGNLSLQLELLLEELDRTESGEDSPRFNWITVDPSFDGDRVRVAPSPPPKGKYAWTARRIVERAIMGIPMVHAGVHPPGFTESSLRYLEWMTLAFEFPGVDRIVFFAGRQTAPISLATRKNAQLLIESVGSMSGPKARAE